MATIFNDWEYQMRLGRIASGESVMAWSDACGSIEVPNLNVESPPQVYGLHNAASVTFTSNYAQPVCSYVGTGYSPHSYDPYVYSTATYKVQPVPEVIYGGMLEDVRVVDIVRDKCTDCKGSGLYVGLLQQETCRKCGGTGEI